MLLGNYPINVVHKIGYGLQ